MVDGIAARGVLPVCDGVLSGYIGAPDVGTAVADAVRRVKAAHSGAVYCCDPVIGDNGAAYVAAGVPEFIRDTLLPLADIATPNQFELEHLTGVDCGTIQGARRAVAALGPRTVLVTSLRTDDTPPGCLDMLVGEAGAFHRLRTPLLASPAERGRRSGADRCRTAAAPPRCRWTRHRSRRRWARWSRPGSARDCSPPSSTVRQGCRTRPLPAGCRRSSGSRRSRSR